MHIIKRVLFSIFFMFSLSISAQQQCSQINITTSESTPGFTGFGSVSINGDMCVVIDMTTYTTQSSGTFNIQFNQFSYNPSNFTMSGNMTIDFAMSTAQPMSATMSYNGGPVNYIIDGQSYEVYYQNLQINLDPFMQYINASGGVTVNGQYLPAENIPYDYLRVI